MMENGAGNAGPVSMPIVPFAKAAAQARRWKNFENVHTPRRRRPL